jgi:glutathione S-transferase
MTAVLYAIPASHPCAVAERALQLKQVPYRRVDLPPVFHRVAQRARFGRTSVPAIEFEDGERCAGSRTIVHALERRVPSPPLLPSGEEERARVERAEEWGDQVLQALARRLIWGSVSRSPAATASYLEGAELPMPRPLALKAAPYVAKLAARLSGASEPALRADLVGLRTTHLGRVEGWIEEGVIGGDGVPNAADLQIASSLRLLLTIEDVAPLMPPRVEELARRVFPEWPGFTPAGAFPPAWVNGLDSELASLSDANSESTAAGRHDGPLPPPQ